MRIRAGGIRDRWIGRAGALLVHPGPGLESFDLADCVVLPELPDTTDGSFLVAHMIVDRPLPEEIDPALERVDELLERSRDEASLTFFLETEGHPTLEYVLASERGHALAVSVVETRAGRLVVGLERARELDRPVDDFVAGLQLSDLGLGARRRSAEHDLREENAILRLKLLDVLTFSLESARSGAEAPGSEVTAATEPDASTVRRLEDEIIRLTRERDALQRKYTALAESRLGRITLDRWERRRRR